MGQFEQHTSSRAMLAAKWLFVWILPFLILMMWLLADDRPSWRTCWAAAMEFWKEFDDPN